MKKDIIHTEKAPAAVGPYVQAIQAGNILSASGQLVNEVYRAFFGEWKPARSCVEVGNLPLNGKVEVEILAVK